MSKLIWGRPGPFSGCRPPHAPPFQCLTLFIRCHKDPQGWIGGGYCDSQWSLAAPPHFFDTPVGSQKFLASCWGKTPCLSTGTTGVFLLTPMAPTLDVVVQWLADLFLDNNAITMPPSTCSISSPVWRGPRPHTFLCGAITSAGVSPWTLPCGPVVTSVVTLLGVCWPSMKTADLSSPPRVAAGGHRAVFFIIRFFFAPSSFSLLLCCYYSFFLLLFVCKYTSKNYCIYIYCTIYSIVYMSLILTKFFF